MRKTILMFVAASLSIACGMIDNKKITVVPYPNEVKIKIVPMFEIQIKLE